MGTDVQVVPATEEHAAALAPNLRAEDVAEVLACGSPSGLFALQHSLRTSDMAWALLFDGEVAALFGFTEHRNTACGGSGVGVAWALTGNAVARHPKVFLRVSRDVLSLLLEHCGVLVNWVDARYRGALRWLEWLGFEVKPATSGPQGMLFHPVVARRQ